MDSNGKDNLIMTHKIIMVFKRYFFVHGIKYIDLSTIYTIISINITKIHIKYGYQRERYGQGINVTFDNWYKHAVFHQLCINTILNLCYIEYVTK